MDVLEDPCLKNVIILQTVLDEVTNYFGIFYCNCVGFLLLFFRRGGGAELGFFFVGV